MQANTHRLYPLIGVPGGPAAPKTDAEKRAYDAGMDGKENPDPNCKRTTELYNWGRETELELELERQMMRGY